LKQEETALDVLVDVLADRIARRLLTAQHDGWTDQSSSPLGPRRHRAAVTRRIQAGEPGAARVGRRHLLSTDALQAELALAGERKTKPAAPSVADDLRAQLRLVGGSR
jgi:hypothetical protein